MMKVFTTTVYGKNKILECKILMGYNIKCELANELKPNYDRN